MNISPFVVLYQKKGNKYHFILNSAVQCQIIVLPTRKKTWITSRETQNFLRDFRFLQR
jgi:hypothetical protein